MWFWWEINPARIGSKASVAHNHSCPYCINTWMGQRVQQVDQWLAFNNARVMLLEIKAKKDASRLHWPRLRTACCLVYWDWLLLGITKRRLAMRILQGMRDVSDLASVVCCCSCFWQCSLKTRNQATNNIVFYLRTANFKTFEVH